MRKLTHEFVKKQFECDNYELVSDTYINAHSALTVRCPNSHISEITWGKWSRGRRCKYCNKSIYIEDIKKLADQENYKLLSTDYVNSKAKLEFLCSADHKALISWSKWKTGTRCKQCYVDYLKIKIDVVKESLDKINCVLLSDEHEFDGSLSFIECLCHKGHKFKTRWSIFSKTMECPVCRILKRNDSFKLDFIRIKESFELDGYKLKSEFYENAFGKLDYTCPNEHVHSIRWNDWQQGIRCPYCSISTSKGEEEISEFLSLYFNDIRTRDRIIICPYELDIVVPSKKIAIEYCGLYWHSEKNGKDKNYHLNKLKRCEESGYRLITIFEDEWLSKRDIVETRLKHIFNTSNAKIVYARNCYVKNIDVRTKNIFLHKHHIQGPDISKIRLGAFYRDVLISVMTFSNRSIAKGKAPENGLLELNRYCCHSGYRVTGIASKLLKYFLNNYEFDNLVSYADRRWSDGGLYKKLGFEFDGFTRPGYWYSKDGITRIHRFGLRKSLYDDKSKTESELRYFEGYYRIWDCGNFRFKFAKN